ncbi:MAG: SGNH/GDSL hydrolase family protein [Deltaproteobacteria bacterium]|nr:SGNH/GDSL hydrolase family protein [Deltaproteobacteria bacterium]
MDTGAVRIDAPHQIIAIGDSLTAGSKPGITEYAPFAEPVSWKLLTTSYPYILGELLSGNVSDDLILNLGRSGSTTRDWLPGRKWAKMDMKDFPLNGAPLDEILQLPQKVKLAIMMLGTNDVCQSMVPDAISRMMGSLVGYEDEEFIALRENIIVTLINLSEMGIITYLAKIPPILYRGGLAFAQMDRLLFFTRRVQERFDRYVRMVNARIDEICTSYPFLVRTGPDFYALFKNRKDIWMKDRLHFNDTGYRLMAEAWASLLTSDGIIVKA